MCEALVASNRNHAWHFDTTKHVEDAAATHGGWVRIGISKYWTIYKDPEARRRCFQQAAPNNMFTHTRYSNTCLNTVLKRFCCNVCANRKQRYNAHPQINQTC